MGWRFSDDPAAYAERVWDLLAGDPARNTAPLTVAAAARQGFRWSEDPMLFGWCEDGGDVRGAVSLTPPHELLLGVVPDGELADLVAGLRDARPVLPGVTGEVGLVDRFVAAWAPPHHELVFRLRLHRLGTLRPPAPPPPGAPRAATAADLDLAARWLRAFEEDAGVTRTDVEAGARERVGDGRFWIWENESGEPVSFAARTATAGGVARVAPVYTPPAYRGHGYGSAITAACTADALARDAEHVVLFTDVDDPTPNAIYQRIGFEPLGDYCTIRFR